MTTDGIDHAGLVMRGIRTAFGRTTVLHGVDLDVRPGETLVLFGPSGAGKTVLLRALAGLDPQSEGQVIAAGRDISVLGPEHRGFGVAFQNFALYPHMTARENIASPLLARKVSGAEVTERVDRIAALLRISHVLAQPPRALSNGQKQRTALARALVAEPKVLLLDDPLRNVDAKLRYEMRIELPRLLRRYNAAPIYVTQDYREAMALGDRIAVLIEGRVVQVDGPEQVYEAPASVAVARLFGDPPLNLVPCRPTASNDGVRVRALGLDLGLPLSPALAGADALLGIRPEDIRVEAGLVDAGLVDAGRVEAGPLAGGAEATVVAVTPLHDKQVMLLRTPGHEEVLASTIGQAPEAGQTVWFTPSVERALLYDAGTGLLHRDEAALLGAAA